MTAFWRDVRYALKLFARERAFTAMAVLTLALGLGSSTAVYSVVDAVLLRPLPYAPSERVVQIVQEFGRGGTIGDRSAALTSAIVIRDRKRIYSAQDAMMYRSTKRPSSPRSRKTRQLVAPLRRRIGSAA